MGRMAGSVETASKPRKHYSLWCRFHEIHKMLWHESCPPRAFFSVERLFSALPSPRKLLQWVSQRCRGLLESSHPPFYCHPALANFYNDRVNGRRSLGKSSWKRVDGSHSRGNFCIACVIACRDLGKTFDVLFHRFRGLWNISKQRVFGRPGAREWSLLQIH